MELHHYRGDYFHLHLYQGAGTCVSFPNGFDHRLDILVAEQPCVVFRGKRAAVNPCLSAFMRERALPCFVFGPVDFFAFRRLAAFAFSEVVFCEWEWGTREVPFTATVSKTSII